jgi:hypothetical protein
LVRTYVINTIAASGSIGCFLYEIGKDAQDDCGFCCPATDQTAL